MKISGINKFSMVNYPNKIACVLFSKGCPLKCKYCYNKILLKLPTIQWSEITEFLEKRKGQLEAVVFSGGEPMAQYEDLNKAIDYCRDLGYEIGLHLTGLHSDKKEFIEIVNKSNWIGLDFKAPEAKYKKICGLDYSDWSRALDIILKSGKDLEVRTTLAKDLTKEDLLEMEKVLIEHNISKWYLQRLMLKEGTFEVPDYDLDGFSIAIEVR